MSTHLKDAIDERNVAGSCRKRSGAFRSSECETLHHRARDLFVKDDVVDEDVGRAAAEDAFVRAGPIGPALEVGVRPGHQWVPSILAAQTPSVLEPDIIHAWADDVCIRREWSLHIEVEVNGGDVIPAVASIGRSNYGCIFVLAGSDAQPRQYYGYDVETPDCGH